MPPAPPPPAPTSAQRVPWGWRWRTRLAALAIPPLLEGVALTRVERWLRGPAAPAARLPLDLPAVADVVDSALWRLPWPWRHTCLRRAAVLYYICRRAGWPAVLCIGARRDASGTFGAHAWLECDDALFLPTPADRTESASYTVLARFPPAG